MIHKTRVNCKHINIQEIKIWICKWPVCGNCGLCYSCKTTKACIWTPLLPVAPKHLKKKTIQRICWDHITITACGRHINP
jgi:hypothetical protein